MVHYVLCLLRSEAEIQNVLDRYQNIFCVESLCDTKGICLFCYFLDSKTIRIFEYSNTGEQSNKRFGTRLNTESEPVERRYYG